MPTPNTTDFKTPLAVVTEHLSDEATQWLAERCEVLHAGTDDPRFLDAAGAIEALVVRTYTIVDAQCGNVQATVLVTVSPFPDPGGDVSIVLCATDSPLNSARRRPSRVHAIALRVAPVVRAHRIIEQRAHGVGPSGDGRASNLGNDATLRAETRRAVLRDHL